MSSSNCCFLTCIQISQEAGQVIWYSHLFQNFPQFIVIHTVKGFGIVNKAEIDVFLDCLAFLMIQRMLAIWSLVFLPFLNPSYTFGSSQFTYCWNLVWTIVSITLLECKISAIVMQLDHSLALPSTSFVCSNASKAHSTSRFRMSGSRWVITPFWLSRSSIPFLYSSVYSCHHSFDLFWLF